MKYTARHVRKFIDQGKIDPDLWMKHFPTVLPTRVPACSDCEDFKTHHCDGGKDPVDCFLAIGLESGSEPAHTGKAKERYRWNGAGRNEHAPANANKAFDQSKE